MSTKMTQLLPCKCGEQEHIYFKNIYNGRRGEDVYIVECQRCGDMVSGICPRYDYGTEKLSVAWNTHVTEGVKDEHQDDD